MDQLKNNLEFESSMGRVWEHQFCSARVIIISLLKTHDGNLTDGSLQTLLVAVKAVVNPHPLKLEAINDRKSLISLGPINLFSIKWKTLMSPLHVFPSSDTYCQRNLRREQHICNEFWDR